mmetsp:Transcript_100502/g.146715  ORF Transcript_100502/g.146715 Transcript_100502/m.146715 type:complete len:82 (+) Transcript_100502:401-646(+)
MCSVSFFDVYTILVYFWLLKNEICHNFSTADGLPGESWLGESWLRVLAVVPAAVSVGDCGFVEHSCRMGLRGSGVKNAQSW